MRKFKPDQNICTYHDYIIENANDICKIRELDYDDIHYLLLEVQRLADLIIENAEYAKVCGEKMEGRMYDYRSAIEGLGFKRDKS